MSKLAGAMQVIQQHELEDSVKANLINLLQENFLDKLKKLNRVVVNEKRFYSEQYTRMQKRICTVVLFRNNEIGKIKYFVFCNYTDSVYAVLQKLERIPEGQENHYIPVTFSQEIVVSNVENLIEVLVYLDLQDVNRKYVIKMPNGYGHAIFKWLRDAIFLLIKVRTEANLMQCIEIPLKQNKYSFIRIQFKLPDLNS